MPENDGWGHTLESTTIADDLKELKGYLDGTDKHEQTMETFEITSKFKKSPDQKPNNQSNKQ